jgi:putative peptidoglycan lipid II flippase
MSETPTVSRTSRLISASAVMAAGTMVSRLLGFVRLMLLVFLFGNGSRQADMFTIANTVPNSMYILLAGGVLNTVLVPQIVRAIRGDKDGGEAYTNRIMTAGLLALGAITVALTVAVPWIIWLYTADGWKSPALAGQYQSMIILAYYCMPQVFFYGVHVLAGQVLNARDKFGPMMWAPIANNIVSILVLLLFLGVFGRGDANQAFDTGEQLLLGLGSTFGIAVQAAVLVPFLRAAGYHYRPRFDFRHTGLGKTFRLAKWTLGFVLVTQLALVVVNRLATAATVGGKGAGLAAYANAYAVWILPHSLITVSLATAMLPAASRLAAAGDLPGVAAEATRAIRLAMTALLPASVAFVAVGLPIAELAFGFGRGARDADYVGYALMALGLGLVPFTVQYLFLRAFYAMEDTRSTFFLQLIVAASNVVLGIGLVSFLSDALVATGLSFAYGGAYVVGVLVSFHWLRRKLPTLAAGELVRHAVRLLVAAIPAAGVAYGICWAFGLWSESKPARLLALAVAGLVAVAIFVLISHALKITEVTEIVAAVVRRGARGGGDIDGGGGSGPGNEFTDPGDSSTAIRPITPTIERTPNPSKNDEPMSQAAAVRTPPADGEDATSESVTVSALSSSTTDSTSASVTTTSAATVSRTAPSLTAGTVLAARYRLEELMRESPPTVTWRAFDQVLSRSVLVHLLAADGPDTDALLALARKASVATDSRFVRVLDVVHSVYAGDDPRTPAEIHAGDDPRTRGDSKAGDDRHTPAEIHAGDDLHTPADSKDPAIGSYIVSEYAVGRSLDVILTHGPLSGLEAAWVVREVADALSGVHSLGLHHRRINPETVIVTPTGNVKIVGLLIEAALRPGGGSESPPPDAGHETDDGERTDVADLGRLLYACLVSRWPGGPAYGLPAAPLLGHHLMTPRQVRAGVSPALDNLCDQILGDPPRHKASQITTANALVNALTKVLGPADASGDLERRLRQPVPKVSVTAPEPAPGESASVGSSKAGAAVRPPTSKPKSTEERAGARSSGATTTRRPPRRWIPILIILVLLLLIAAGVTAGVVLTNRSGAASPKASTTSSTGGSTTTPPVQGVRIPIVDGQDFDPQGDDKTENPTLVKYAYDGSLTTRWKTLQYLNNPRLGGIKRGVGLVLDLGTAQPVQSAALTLSGNGTNIELRVPKTDPAQITKPPMASDNLWRSVAKQSKAGRNAILTASQPVTTRFVLIYLTSLPKEGKGYRGGVYEVEVRQ